MTTVNTGAARLPALRDAWMPGAGAIAWNKLKKLHDGSIGAMYISGLALESGDGGTIGTVKCTLIKTSRVR